MRMVLGIVYGISGVSLVKGVPRRSSIETGPGPTAFFKPPLRGKRHGKTESDGLGLQRLSDKAMSTFHSSKGG